MVWVDITSKLVRCGSNPPNVSRDVLKVAGLQRDVARKRDVRRGPVRVVTTSSEERSVKKGE